MKINIDKIARTSRLKLTEEEKKEFEKDLESIIDAFNIIQKVNVKDVKPTFSPINVKNVLREDVVGESLNTIEILSRVKNKDNSYYKGPKVL